MVLVGYLQAFSIAEVNTGWDWTPIFLDEACRAGR